MPGLEEGSAHTPSVVPHRVKNSHMTNAPWLPALRGNHRGNSEPGVEREVRCTYQSDWLVMGDLSALDALFVLVSLHYDFNFINVLVGARQTFNVRCWDTHPIH